MDNFHGREAQEASLEVLDAPSMQENVESPGSYLGGLKKVRDLIIKHTNLVPKELQSDQDQRR